VPPFPARCVIAAIARHPGDVKSCLPGGSPARARARRSSAAASTCLPSPLVCSLQPRPLEESESRRGETSVPSSIAPEIPVLSTRPSNGACRAHGFGDGLPTHGSGLESGLAALSELTASEKAYPPRRFDGSGRRVELRQGRNLDLATTFRTVVLYQRCLR
jgi:hypothetical protein